MLGFKNLKIPTKKPGDPLYAAEFNMLVKAVAARLQSAPLGIVSPLGTFLHRQWQNRIEPDVILVKNTSEETIPEFGILGLEDPVALPGSDLPEFKSRIVMEGAIPALASHVGKVAVAIYAIAPDETGPCYVSGYCQVQIDVTDAAHTTCEVKDGDHTQLESKSDGTIPIIWKDSGTGTKWAIIYLAAVANRSIIMARITDYATLATNRWKYAWTEQELDGDTFQNKSGGLSGTTTDGYALNMIEAFNTSDHAAPGIDMGGTAYPAGFSLMPIGESGDGVDVEPVVAMWQILDVDLEPRWVFECVNAHDGECE